AHAAPAQLAEDLVSRHARQRRCEDIVRAGARKRDGCGRRRDAGIGHLRRQRVAFRRCRRQRGVLACLARRFRHPIPPSAGSRWTARHRPAPQRSCLTLLHSEKERNRPKIPRLAYSSVTLQPQIHLARLPHPLHNVPVSVQARRPSVSAFWRGWFCLLFVRRLLLGVAAAYIATSLLLGGTRAAVPGFQALAVAWTLVVGTLHLRRRGAHTAQLSPSQPTRWSSWLGRVEVVAFNVVVTLVLAEIALRLFA